MNEGWRNLQKYVVQRVANFDQELKGVRDFYNELTPQERACYREALVKVIEAEELIAGIRGGAGGFALTVFEEGIDNEGELIYTLGGGPLGAKPILNAWDAWERGEEFTPDCSGTF